MDNSFTRVIKVLRFPLAILIVLQHCIGPEVNMAFVVFLFFFISGYLFYFNYKPEESKVSFFRNKIVGRFYSLFIPYVLWNIIYAICLFIVNKQSFIEQTEGNLLCIFWHINGSSFVPINGPLWFVRNLIIYVLLSPVIFYIIRHTASTVLFICLYSFIYLKYSLGFDWLGILMFEMGGYCAMRKTDITKHFDDFKILFVLLIVFCPIYYLAFICRFVHHGIYIFLYQIVASFCVLCIGRIIENRGYYYGPEWITKTSFYIYVSHAIFYLFVFTPMMKMNMAHGTRAIATPLIIFCCLASYYMLDRKFPKFLGTLLGNKKVIQKLFNRIS